MGKGVDILIHDRQTNQYIGKLKNIEQFDFEDIELFIKRTCDKLGIERK